MRKSLGALLVFAMTLVAVSAGASDTYPDAIKADLMLTASPGCDLCHNGGVGEKGNVNTPFGKTARSLGLVSGDTNSLKTVLDAMKAMNTDSDGDGTGDIDELVKGTNPNFNEITGMAPGGADFPPPEYGCTVAWRAPSSGGAGAAALLLSWLMSVVYRRARGRTKVLSDRERSS
jgi:hypothetical protein